jgi:hypothetical protein
MSKETYNGFGWPVHIDIETWTRAVQWLKATYGEVGEGWEYRDLQVWFRSGADATAYILKWVK